MASPEKKNHLSAADSWQLSVVFITSVSLPYIKLSADQREALEDNQMKLLMVSNYRRGFMCDSRYDDGFYPQLSVDPYLFDLL